MRIFTHLAIDMDAAAAIWAVKKFVPGMHEAEIIQVPSNWDGKELRITDLAVDIEAEGLGIKGDDRVSAFGAVMRKYAPKEVLYAMDQIIHFIDLQDTKAMATKSLLPNAGRREQMLIASINLNAVFRALLHTFPGEDLTVCERFGEILTGMLKYHLSRSETENDADKAVYVGEQRKVAVIIDAQNKGTASLLFQRGVKIVVIKDGNNLCVLRESRYQFDVTRDELRAVVKQAGEENKWFAHKSGYLFAHGTRSAPAPTQSKVDPFELAQVAARLIS